MVLAVVKVRGHIDSNPDVKKTLALLGLNRTNHCILMKENPQVLGMLKICSRYLTWGEVKKETILLMLKKRAEKGKKKATELYDEEQLNDIAEKISKGEQKLSDYFDRVIRLTPPSKGYRNIKKLFQKGALGPRDDMDELLMRMI